MPLPSVDREAVLAALRTFDDQLRNSPDWSRWEDNRAQVYALEWEGRRYPPKQVLSLATGIPLSQFSGGQETNDYFVRRGFQVQHLREQKLADIFKLILERYGTARRQEAFSGYHLIRELFADARRILERHPRINARGQTLRVVASYGKGNWATIPWISVLDLRETDTTQDGVYVVFLFREDGRGVYIKLAQGVTVLEKQLGARAVDVMREKSGRLRDELGSLRNHGFDLTGKSDLGADQRLARLYEASTIAAKFYPANEMPGDEQLFSDLDVLLDAYNTYVLAHPRPSSTTNRADSVEEPMLDEPAVYDMEWLQSETRLDKSFLREVIQTLTRGTPQILLAGPPGTSKTWVAKALAKHLTQGREGAVRTVQFHPSYT